MGGIYPIAPTAINPNKKTDNKTNPPNASHKALIMVRFDPD